MVLTKQPDDPSCAGDLWLADLQHIPLILTQAYTDAQDASRGANALQLSHKQRENVILVVAKVKPKAGVTANAQIWYAYTKMTYTETEETQQMLSLINGSFRKAGEVKP